MAIKNPFNKKNEFPRKLEDLLEAVLYSALFGKIRRITGHRFTIRQKLAALGIIHVWTYEKAGRVIWLESESDPCILDEYGEY